MPLPRARAGKPPSCPQARWGGEEKRRRREKKKKRRGERRRRRREEEEEKKEKGRRGGEEKRKTGGEKRKTGDQRLHVEPCARRTPRAVGTKEGDEFHGVGHELLVVLSQRR